MRDQFVGKEVIVPIFITEILHEALCKRFGISQKKGFYTSTYPVTKKLQELHSEKFRENLSPKILRYINTRVDRKRDFYISLDDKLYKERLQGFRELNYKYLDFLCLVAWGKSLALCLLCTEFNETEHTLSIDSEEFGRAEYLELKKIIFKKNLTISLIEKIGDEQLLKIRDVEDKPVEEYEYADDKDESIPEHIIQLKDYEASEKFLIDAVKEVEEKKDESLYAFKVYGFRAYLLRHIDNDFAASNDFLRKSLSIASNHQLHNKVADINSEIASNLAHLGDDFAETLSESYLKYYLEKDDYDQKISAYISHANILRILGNFGKAREQVKYALEINHKHFYVTKQTQDIYERNQANCNRALAHICHDENTPLEAIFYINQCMNYFEKGDDIRTVADLNYALAICELLVGRATSKTWITALSAAKKGYAEINYHNGVAECIFFLAKMAKIYGMPHYSNGILMGNKEFLFSTNRNQARCLMEFAEHEIACGSSSDAIPILMKLSELCRSENIHELLIESEKKLGEIYLAKKLYEIAKKFFDSASNELKDKYEISNIKQAETTSKLAEIDFIRGNYSTALASFKSCLGIFKQHELIAFYQTKLRIADLYIALHQVSNAMAIWDELNNLQLPNRDWFEEIQLITKLRLARIYLSGKNLQKCEQYLLEVDNLNKNWNLDKNYEAKQLRTTLQNLKYITSKNQHRFNPAIERLFTKNLSANGILYWYDRYAIVVLNNFYHIAGLKAIFFISRNFDLTKEFQRRYKWLFEYCLEMENLENYTAVFEKFPYPFSSLDNENVIDEKPKELITISSDEDYVWSRIDNDENISEYTFDVRREAGNKQQIYCEGYCDGYVAAISHFIRKNSPRSIINLRYFPLKYKNYSRGNWQRDIIFCYQLGVMPVFTKDERNDHHLNIIREVNLCLSSSKSPEIKSIFTALLNATKDEVNQLLNKLTFESSKKTIFLTHKCEMTILIVELDFVTSTVYPIILLHN